MLILTGRRAFTFAVLAALLAVSPCFSAASAGDASLKSETRTLWARVGDDYLRDWLICGDFPNPPEDRDTEGPDVPRIGLETDFLAERGGEAAIAPIAGMTHTRPDGTEVEWREYNSPANTLDFARAFAERPTEFVVGYAFATITSLEAGDAVLAVGSDDGVRVWLNGRLVHDHAVQRGVTPDEDLIPVTLAAGENRLLLKVEQGVGGWGLAARVIDIDAARELLGETLSPSIAEGDDGEAGKLVILTNKAATGIASAGQLVTVEVVAAGGRVVAKQRAPNGDRAVFDPSGWNDGAYEVICRISAPTGRELAAYLPWYKGDAVAAAKAVVASAADADPSTPAGMIHAMLADMLLYKAAGDLDSIPPEQVPRLYLMLMEFEELAREQAGKVGGVRPRGMVRLAYRDEVDDSPQFCRALLPPGYRPDVRWPLIVNLHGYYPANPPYVQWWDADSRHDRLQYRSDHAIVIQPMGRYNTSYRGIGDTDVVRCIDLAKERFSVDEDRVYLTGYSMGGAGTWHVGARHPDLFAALGPYFGGSDYRVLLSEEELGRLTKRAQFLKERGSSFAQAEQLLNLPIWVMHGDSDAIVHPDHSRYAVRMLQRWGFDIRYQEIPGRGHEYLWTEDALYAWFLERERDSSPKRVRVRAADLKSASAYWVSIGQRKDPFAFINADAEVVAPNLIRLDTQNVLEVTLSPGDGLIDPDRPLRVRWNANDVRAVNLNEDGRVMLRAQGYVPGSLVKSAQVEGPVSDIWTTPFAIVVGTISPDPLMRRLCERQAQSAISDWERRQHATPRVFEDTQMTVEDMRKYSLVLFGGPDANAVTKELIDDLPLRVSADEIAIDGRAFPARDAAVTLIYPNPLNPARYVQVTAATSAAGMSYGDRLPEGYDFCVADGRMADSEEGRPSEKVFITSGSFDHVWQFDPDYAIAGDPETRAQSPVRRGPGHLSAAVEADSLMLSDLLETKAEGTFGRMMRDLNWNGDPIALGGKTYAKGIAVNTSDGANWAEFDISGGGWGRLRGIIGIEVTPEEDTEQLYRDNTRAIFVVTGDGGELCRSEPFIWGSEPRELDIDVGGVKTLRLQVVLGALPRDAVISANWADLRLER